jgi:hypothetical protein
MKPHLPSNYRNAEQRRIEAVDCLLAHGFITQACQMIHCLIERIAYLNLADSKTENGSEDYREVINQYIMPRLSGVPYDANDLFGQRCGAIHSGTHQGQGNAGKKQRNFKWQYKDYAAKCRNLADCQNTIDADLETFWLAVRQGTQEFFRQHSGKWTAVQKERFSRTMEYVRLVFCP